MRACLAFAALAVAFAAGGVAGRSDAYPGCAAGKDLGFRAADGTQLVGHRFGTGPKAVILGHQSDGSVCQWVPYAKRLATLDYTAIAFDFRGHGYSRTGRRFPVTARYPADMIAAVRVARKLGAKSVVLVGASAGGNAAVFAAANARPPVQGVVSLSGPAQWSGDGVRAAKRLTMPTLFAAAKQDGTFADEAKAMYEAAASTDKTLAIVPGSQHGVALVAAPGRVRSLVETFLRAHG